MIPSRRQRFAKRVERFVAIAGVVLISWAAALVTSSAAMAQNAALQGAPIRVLMRSFSGDSVRVGAGAPPTVLAVFATWCRTCQDEVPALNMLQREFGPRGVRVVGLSMDEVSNERVEKWLKQHGATYAVARDSTGAIARSIGVVGVPEVYLVNGSGQIQWTRRGPFMSGLPELRALLKQIPAPRP